MKITSAEAQSITNLLRNSVIETIKTFFIKKRKVFEFKEPLILIEADDGNNNQVLDSVTADDVSVRYEWDDGDDLLSFEKVETRHLIWILEQMENDKGYWVKNTVKQKYIC